MSILSTWPDAADPFRERADAHSGLDFAYGAGRVRDDNTVTDVAAGTVTCTDATTNYVEVSSAGTVSANTSGFTAGAVPLYTVVTSGGAIGTVTDRRTFLLPPGASGALAADFEFPMSADPSATSTAAGLSVITANRAHFFRSMHGGTISKIGLEVVAQSGNIDVGVYSNSGTGRSAVPGARIGSSGSVACPAVGYAEVALGSSVDVEPGDWIAIVADNTSATFRTTNNGALGNSLGIGRQAEQFSAFPLPATAGASGGPTGRLFTLVGVA